MVLLIGPTVYGKTTLTARLAGNDSIFVSYPTIGKELFITCRYWLKNSKIEHNDNEYNIKYFDTTG